MGTSFHTFFSTNACSVDCHPFGIAITCGCLCDLVTLSLPRDAPWRVYVTGLSWIVMYTINLMSFFQENLPSCENSSTIEMFTKYEGTVNFLKQNISDIMYRQRKKIRWNISDIHSKSLFPSSYFSRLVTLPAMCSLHFINRGHNVYERKRNHSKEARIP